jgi:hypothetical protein
VTLIIRLVVRDRPNHRNAARLALAVIAAMLVALLALFAMSAFRGLAGLSTSRAVGRRIAETDMSGRLSR